MQFAPGAWRYALAPFVAAPFTLFVSAPAGAILALLGVAVLAFFRDPDRSTPATGVVAPADGTISVLRREDGGVRVGVFMNVWNVHVARAPAAGRVSDVEHTPGANKPAFSKDSDRNERVHVRFVTDDENGESEADERSDADNGSDADEESDFDELDPSDPAGNREPTDDTLLDVDPTREEQIEEVTLIAGAFARRITPYVEPGETIDRGDRIGHIAFGSRVDVVFPPSVSLDDITVDPGERVTAGETVLLDSIAAVSATDSTTIQTNSVNEGSELP